MEEVILTPIYKEEIYKYHECSNCKEKIYMKEDMFVSFHFEKKIKYCPFCGKKIIRYAKPQYEKLPDWSWMDKFQKILDRADRNIEYEIFCKMTNEEQRALIDKANFGEKYFGSSLSWNGNSKVCEIIKEIAHRKPHYSYKNKLKNEFGGVNG